MKINNENFIDDKNFTIIRENDMFFYSYEKTISKKLSLNLNNFSEINEQKEEKILLRINHKVPKKVIIILHEPLFNIVLENEPLSIEKAYEYGFDENFIKSHSLIIDDENEINYLHQKMYYKLKFEIK